jgi:hypothetical protein
MADMLPEYKQFNIITAMMYAKLVGRINWEKLFWLLPISSEATNYPNNQRSIKNWVPKMGSIYSLKMKSDRTKQVHRRGIVVKDTNPFPHSITCYISIGDKNACVRISEEIIHVCGIKREDQTVRAVTLIVDHVNEIVKLMKQIRDDPYHARGIIQAIEAQGPSIQKFIDDPLYHYFRSFQIEFKKFHRYIEWLHRLVNENGMSRHPELIADKVIDVECYTSKLYNVQFEISRPLNLTLIAERLNNQRNVCHSFNPEIRQTSFKVEIPYDSPEQSKTRKKEKDCITFRIPKTGKLAISGPSAQLVEEAYNYIRHLAGNGIYLDPETDDML